MSEAKTHPFEKTLGPGPYRFLYVVTISVTEARGTQVFNSSGDEEGIGTCCHCGMGIMNCYVLLCGDGKKRAVGSDCIAKSNLPMPVRTAAEKARLKLEREKRKARKQARHLAALEETRALVDQHREALAKIRHPHVFEMNFLEYAEHCIQVTRNAIYIRAAIKAEIAKLEGKS
jgi:hypothetical protein